MQCECNVMCLLIINDCVTGSEIFYMIDHEQKGNNKKLVRLNPLLQNRDLCDRKALNSDLEEMFWSVK